ncbi:peptidoglycan DD-metalloendopeptidase family protein [Leptothoe sp. PORK10 BA2]|uniref:peptidoglycan DD-metalloendopeptidase family protein n=1 Tax=Leptothoe sp. PORK10 BA2 TaxID=3110254 RepID=UPI002B21B150|nr:peptidoglycan DD-metalloendopeptidase family protein [Leptothoe sp. PORK10 BA2]MEA5463383.1 peptidoglycan DD-metalloendopeptidase family protein [Leptothoe sp. PORK10 BA2]
MRRRLLKSYTVLVTRSGQTPVTVTFSPLAGVIAAVVLLGVPLGWLGAVIFSLFQSNVQLADENRQLTDQAHEVLTELNTLDSEIENLKERAGLPDNQDQQNVDLDNNVPQGGEAVVASGLELYEKAKTKLPQLSEVVDASIKPALEQTLAAEEAEVAAYPDGLPVGGPLDISSEFGIRRNPFGGYAYETHEGTDFAGPYGSPIFATADGLVDRAEYYGGYGNSVTIKHGYGYETLYAHMSKLAVESGVKVKRGDVIGYLGNTGRSSGPHLHYGIYYRGEAVNPRNHMKMTHDMNVVDYWRLR